MNSELLLIIIIAIVVLFWLDGIRIKEIARDVAGRLCLKSQLHLLDDTVALKSFRMARDEHGRVRLVRRFLFEFTSDGTQRYNGHIEMMGRHVRDVQLSVHRMPDDLNH